MKGYVAVLISGRGSNLRAILQSPVGARVIAVVSDNEQAPGLKYAEQYGKEAFIIAPHDFNSLNEWEEKLTELLTALQPDIIALAGFMRILSPTIINAFVGRIVNIHPSLLPSFPGLNTHERALAAAASEHGCTVHYVSAQVDGGKIISRQKVPVLASDNKDALAARVLAEEHKLYPRTLEKLLT